MIDWKVYEKELEESIKQTWSHLIDLSNGVEKLGGGGRCGCYTRRPTSHPRARPTAWAAWVCSAASRPRTREAWWNSG